MKPEIEVKFIDVNIDDVRSRLEQAGATLEQPMRDMRRVFIETDQHAADNMFIRVRDEGDKVTLCVKKKTKSLMESTLDSTYEVETTVGDFDKTLEIFKVGGWDYKSYQESRRETWQLDDAEVVIDEWPWIKPFIEIEGETEQVVRSVADRLVFDWSTAVFGSVDVIYNLKFPDITVRGVSDITEVRFADPIPAEFGEYVEG